jgi:hypothetical protein
MEETGAGDFPEDSGRVLRQALRQLSAGLAVERALRIEKVGAIEDAPHHVPLGEAYRVIPDRIEYAPIDLALRLGVRRAGWSMPELLWPRRGGGPLRQFLRWGVP